MNKFAKLAEQLHQDDVQPRWISSGEPMCDGDGNNHRCPHFDTSAGICAKLHTAPPQHCSVAVAAMAKLLGATERSTKQIRQLQSFFS